MVRASRESGFRHFRDDADLKDELQVHLELQAEDKFAAPGSLARRSSQAGADGRLGSTQAIVENVRDQRVQHRAGELLPGFHSGTSFAARNPVFAITAILTLAVGIGANTVIFTLLYGLLLRSLPVKDPGSLVRIGVASATVDPSRQARFRTRCFAFPPPAEVVRGYFRVVRVQSRWTPATALHGAPAGFISGNGFELFGMNA